MPSLPLRLLFALWFLVHPSLAVTDQKSSWSPVPAEELALTDDPAAPGAPALILYRDYVADDVNGFVSEYVRIKVLKDAGKKYADIEIPYFDDIYAVDRIEARTTRPDGTSVIFAGTIHEKVLARARSVKLLAKTFTLPEVQVGSILEYRYRLTRKAFFLMQHQWQVQADLFTRRAHFELRPLTPPGAALVATYRFMPEGKTVQAKSGGFSLDIENMPGLESEEWMPPAGEVRAGVDLVYRRAQWQGIPDVFWKDAAERFGKAVDEFVGKNGAAKAEVARIVVVGDDDEAKLRKLYTRAQQLRNTDEDGARSEKEAKRQKLKENKSVDDTLSHGYGNGVDITLTFIALARAAGFDSGIAMVTSRVRSSFHKEILSTSQVNAYLAWVDVGTKTVFLDPATRFCPYGVLSWDQSATEGIRGGAKGSVFVRTPPAASSAALTRRSGELRLGPDGSLRGDVTVSWTGLEALERRNGAYEQDEAGRRKYLEDTVKLTFPAGTRISLRRAEHWSDADAPLTATFQIEIPSYATVTGKRLLVPPVLTGAAETRPFQQKTRKQEVALPHGFRDEDDFLVSLPEGFEVESLPSPPSQDDSVAEYSLKAEVTSPGVLHLARIFELREWHFPVPAYGRLWTAYNKAQAGDSQQAVFTNRASTSTR